MLKMDNLTRTFDGPEGTVTALDGVSLRLEDGDFLSVHGPSGCGKTTLLLTTGGLLKPTDGRLDIDRVDPYALSPDKRAAWRAKNIGFVFQQFHLIPYLNVLDNVLAAQLPLRSPDGQQRAMELAEKFNLTQRLRHVPSELSTGERQRVALARALLNRPRLLLADEPTGNLDEINAKTVLQALAEYAEQGGAVLLVTHDPRAAGFAHRTVGMEAGQLIDSL